MSEKAKGIAATVCSVLLLASFAVGVFVLDARERAKDKAEWDELFRMCDEINAKLREAEANLRQLDYMAFKINQTATNIANLPPPYLNR